MRASIAGIQTAAQRTGLVIDELGRGDSSIEPLEEPSPAIGSLIIGKGEVGEAVGSAGGEIRKVSAAAPGRSIIIEGTACRPG